MMIHFKLILFFCLFSTFAKAQTCNWQTKNGENWMTPEKSIWIVESDCDTKNDTPSVPTLFPNPTMDYFEITGIEKNTDAYIYDAIGRFIKKVNLNYEVDVSQLAQGIYFIKFKNKILKFIKL